MNPLRRARAAPPPKFGTPPAVVAKARTILDAVDDDRDAQMKTALVHLSAGKQHRDIVLAVMGKHGIPAHEAEEIVAASKEKIRAHMDDEGTVDVVMYGAAARLHAIQERFFDIAMSPVPEQTVDVLGADPEKPLDGAVYRPLTVSERATEVGVRVQSAKLSMQANQALAGIVGRRSARWADRPANVAVQVNVGTELSPQDRETLEKLRLASTRTR